MKKISKSFVKLAIVGLLVSSVFAQNSVSKEELKPLEFGQTTEAEIGGYYKNHLYSLSLQTGQFVKIEAEEAGCDVVFMLMSLDGKNMLEIKNGANGSGTETASAAVRADGNYELRVISFAEKTGKYKLKIAELRNASEDELNLTDGMILNNDAFNLSVSYSATTGDIIKGISIYEKAVEKFRLAKADKFLGSVLNTIGFLFERLGNRSKGIEYFQKAAETVRNSEIIEAQYTYGTTLNNLGAAYLTLGDFQTALDYFFQSLESRRKTKHFRGEVLTLDNIGRTFQKSGDAERALIYHEQALEISRKNNLTVNDFSMTHNHLGTAYLALKQTEKALEHFQKALDFAKQAGNKRREAAFSGNFGRAYFAAGNSAKAVELIEESLKINRSLQDKVGEAASLKQLGQVFYELGETEKSLNLLEQSLEIYRSLEDTQNLAETLLALAKAESKKGNLPAAQTKIEEAVGLIEKIRSRFQTSDLRDSFSAKLQDFYGFYVEILMKRHASGDKTKNFAALAFEANERSRSRGLLNLLTEANAEIREGVDAKLLQKENETRELLSARRENLTRILSKKTKPEEIEKLRREIEEIRAEYEQIQAQILSKSPRYAALTQPQTMTLTEIQSKVLETNSVLLEYALGEEKSYLWIVTKNDFQTIELPKRESIETIAKQFYDALTARNREIKFETAEERRTRLEFADADFMTYSKALSQIILAPVVSRLADKNLLIVADGSLQYIPFSALISNGKYLVETNEIVNLPSVSVLAVLRNDLKEKPKPTKTLMMMADPIFEKTDARLANKINKIPTFETVSARKPTREGFELIRLPFTRREAQMVSSLVPANQQTKRLDFQANREFVFSAKLSEYRFIHFATHGFINTQNPELSGIVLSLFDETGAEQDGFLRVGDIYNLRLNAEMVVLSGCRTGLGREIKGEGLIGLTRGFMYAGARRVAVSLWDVNDEATSVLMANFYGEMLGDKKLVPASALRQSQISMIRDKKWSNPYYWASFTLQGETR